jgi:tripartite ATP-independent transporter DctP family solute receptor
MSTPLVLLAGAPANAVTTIKIAFNQNLSHPEAKALQAASDKLEKLTEGRYNFQIFPNETLGDQRATIELVQNGALELALTGNPLMENYNKDFGVLGLPYLFDSLDHQLAVFKSDALDELFSSLQDKNFQVLAAYTSGVRNIYTDKPIKTPEDLKGYKIRVMQSETMVNLINAMGGVGTPMAQGEVYTAIQQKVIEGGENNEFIYTSLKHYEVAPVYSYTKHLMQPDLLVANKKFLDSLDAKDRDALVQVVKESVETEFAMWNEDLAVVKKQAEDAKATFVDVDIKPFQERCMVLHETTIKSSAGAKKIYDAIRGMAK